MQVSAVSSWMPGGLEVTFLHRDAVTPACHYVKARYWAHQLQLYCAGFGG